MSIPLVQIHIKQCKKKFVQQEQQKPKHERRPLPQPPQTFQQGNDDDSAQARPRTAPQGGSGWSAEELEAHNAAALKTFNEESLTQCENWYV